MKILISGMEEGLDGKFSERFARADFFTIYNTETKETKSESNPFKEGASGVGVKVSQYLADNNINIAISGHFGPKASDALKSFGIKMYEFKGDTIQNAISAFEDGKLTEH